jgi:hypothetical protein
MNKIRFYQDFQNMIGANDSFTNFTNWFGNKVKAYSDKAIDAKFKPVWNILVNRHLTDYVLYRDYDFEKTLEEGFTPNFTTEDYPNKWCRQFYQIYLSTYERYIALIDFYQAKKAQLLDKIGSETKAKFNDTPQNGGDFDNDEHLSTITTTTTEQDLVPLINRLDGISRLYKDVLSDWADEFAPLFIAAGYNDHE